MRLRHSHDRYYDLTAQLEQLSRDTTEMLLETLGSIPIVGNGIFNDMQYMTELDTLLKNWDENTERLLRFYPATSNKTARFNRYAI